MTVSSSTNKVSYSGNGTLTTFAYSFKIFDQDDLTVILRAADGTETTQTITTHYTVTGVGSASGGNVVFGTAPASGVTVVIIREQPLTQGLDLVPNDPFPAQSLEESLDKLTFMAQKHEEELSRTIKGSRTNVIANSEFTVSAADRANKLFSFDSSGNLSIAQELGTFRGNWAASTAYNPRDIVKDTSTNNIFLVNTAHTSSGAQPLTTNANSAKYDLIVDAASSTTAQTAAASSATAAASSATAAASSATASETAKTASETAKTASETAKTASETAQAASEAALDSFDDRYLGAKSTSGGNPTVDNDGDALIDGALFFDTTNNVLMVYNLGTTTWLRTTPTSSDQTAINAVNADATDIGTVAGISSEVQSVAAKASLITSDFVSDLNTLATTAIVEDLNILATSDVVSDLNTLATSDIVSDINTLATSDIVSDLNTLATSDIVSDLNTLATTDIVSDINTLATSDIVSDLNTLATSDIVSDINTLATSDIVSDLNTLATSDFVSDLNTLATTTNVNNLSTVVANISGVNSFAERYRVSSSDPTSSLDEGDLAYNSTSNILKYYNGTSWQSISPGIGSVADDSSPQLGGNLDLNSNDITGTGNINITGTVTADGLTVDGNATITVADNSDALTLVSTDADANAGPKLKLRRNSASPADDDLIGAIDWTSENSDGDEHDFLNLTARMRDVTAGSEDVAYAWSAYLNGTAREIQSFVNTDASAASMVFNEDSQDIDFRVESNGNANMLFVDAGNDAVGIGTSSPSEKLTIQSGNLNFMGGTNDAQYIKFGDTGDDDIGNIFYYHGNNNMVFTTNASEAMRIDSSGNLLVGKTAAGIANTGSEFSSTGRAYFTFDGGGPLQLNRKTSDGDIIELHKDGTEVGSIGVATAGASDENLYIANGDTGLRFRYNDDSIVPSNNTGSFRDNAIDLGLSNARFKDLYLSGGVVDTTTTVSYASSIALSYDNGAIQTVTLTGNVTFTDSLADGEAVVLMLLAGASHTVTWTAVNYWVSSGGNAAPTLTAKDTIVLWKIGSDVYAAYAGSFA